MDDYLSVMLFAEDMMYFLMMDEGEVWSGSVGGLAEIANTVTSRYFDDVAVAVHTTFRENLDDIRTCQEEMMNEGLVTDCNDFARLALEAAPVYFPWGYTPETFIAFCAMVMGVAFLFNIHKNDTRYLESATGVMSTVLIGYMLTGDFEKEGGWSQLNSVCTFFNECHENKEKDGETGCSTIEDAQEC